jgi:16S rRNA processing protein RimM
VDDRAPRQEAELTTRASDDSRGIRPTSLVVGLVRGVHGLHGAVRVEVLTDRPEERFAAGAVVHPEGRPDELTVSAAAPVADGPGWRVTFHEVHDRNAAERLRGVYLEAAVPPTELPGRGEYYWHEVIGVTVTDTAGNPLGTVRDVYRAGGAEVFVVDGGPVGSFDLPAVRAFIRIFAPRRGEIVVDADALDLRAPKPRRRAQP